MRFPPALIDEIKARVPVSAVVGKRVRLQKAGREWKGLSPFQAEKTPSFFVNDQKQAWFDFSSGKNGNVFTFLMEIEGLSFPDAVERLAGEAGVALPKRQNDERSKQAEIVYRGARAALDEAAAWFAARLSAAPNALGYLDARDIEPATAKQWGIGYAPDIWDGLLKHLRSDGIGIDAIKASGLIIHGDDIDRPHDRFRGRLMFPIHDQRGRIVSFGGRIIGAGEPKYLNGPETETFDKGRILFGLDRAQEAIRKSGVAVVGEGYLDVIRPHQAGFRNIVAPLGTALQEAHLHALWRLCPLIVICLDGDAAGQRAAARAMETALPMIAGDRRLAFAELPAGMDPDDVIAQGGRSALKQAVDSAAQLVDAIWKLASQLDDGSPEGKGAVLTEAKRLAGLIGDDETRKAYLREIERRGRPSRARLATVPVPPAGTINPSEAAIILGAALWPSYVTAADERLGVLVLESPLAREVRDALIEGTFAGERADRHCAVLRSQLPKPEPSFITQEDVAMWLDCLSLREANAARRRRRRAQTQDQQ